MYTVHKYFRHNAEDFSKLAFGAGKHRDFDMSAPRCHFASFMALTPTIRGRMDTYLALENWNNKILNPLGQNFVRHMKRQSKVAEFRAYIYIMIHLMECWFYKDLKRKQSKNQIHPRIMKQLKNLYSPIPFIISIKILNMFSNLV